MIQFLINAYTTELTQSYINTLAPFYVDIDSFLFCSFPVQFFTPHDLWYVSGRWWTNTVPQSMDSFNGLP